MVQYDFHAVDAHVQLANASKKEKDNFAKPEIQNMLKSAKSISLFDADNDNKLGDNEYLLVQSQDDKYSVIYSPKNGATRTDILQRLLSRYSVELSGDILGKIDYQDFLKISVNTSATTDKLKEVTAESITKILNNNGKHNFNVKLEQKDGCLTLVLLLNTGRKLFYNKPTLGYIKEKLGLEDNVILTSSDVEVAQNIATPPEQDNYNFDAWDIKENTPIRIPFSQLFKRK